MVGEARHRGPGAAGAAGARARSAIAGAARRVADALLDPTVVLSFDRTGFLRHAAGFDPRDLEVDLRGRTYLVTGASSGIGLATARALAARGGDVHLLCRDRGRGEAALAEVRAAAGGAGGAARLDLVDLADLASVRRLGDALAAGAVDALIHNAGVLPARLAFSPQGLELTAATHLAGPTLLTALLLPRLRRAVTSGRGAPARVIFVSSGGMYAQRLEVERLAPRGEPYDGVTAYAHTKRAQVVLAELLAERLTAAGVHVNAMHPGWADTPSVRRSLPRFYRVTRRILRTPEQAADTVVWLAAAEAAAPLSGRFVFDRRPRRTHWLPWTRERPAERDALYRACLRWAGLEADPFAFAAPHARPH